MRVMTRFTWLALILLLSGCGPRAEPDRASSHGASPITAYFTDPLAGLPALENYPAQAKGLDRALIALIDSAQKTLDAAVYSFSLPALAEALERACRREVRVRLVMERETAGSFYRDRLASRDCPEAKLDENKGLMHEKFLVVDGSAVWVGSHNWTCLDIYTDANNALLIQDTSIAEAFAAEFEELYNGRFGEHKRDANEEFFRLDDRSIELYFGPVDAPREAIIKKIQSARASIHIAMYAFTDNELKRALLEAQARGPLVQAVWDYQGVSLTGSDVPAMLNRGIGVLDANPGLVHHKFAIIDERLVLTGSANWSRAGLEKNDEYVLIVEDAELARAYLAHWQRLYGDALRYDREPRQAPRLHIRVFWRSERANKFGVRVEWRPHLVKPVDEYALCRARTLRGPCEQTFPGIAPGLDYFVDPAAVAGQDYYYRLRGRVGYQWSDYSNIYATQRTGHCS